jgi:hypothetical protein
VGFNDFVLCSRCGKEAIANDARFPARPQKRVAPIHLLQLDVFPAFLPVGLKRWLTYCRTLIMFN